MKTSGVINMLSKSLDDSSNFLKKFAKDFDSKGIDPIETVSEFFGKAGKKEAKEKVQKIAKKDFSERGLHGAIKNINDGSTLGEAMKSAYTKADNEKIAASTILGSYAAVNAGARVLGGGGLYKDRNGNTDIVGLPLI